MCELICFLLPVMFTLPDPSMQQHEEVAIHLNLSGPCERPPQAAALQPARSHLLLQCGAARTEGGNNDLDLHCTGFLIDYALCIKPRVDFTLKLQF